MVGKHAVLAGGLLVGAFTLSVSGWTINFEHTKKNQETGINAPFNPTRSTYPMYINNYLYGERGVSACLADQIWRFGTGITGGPGIPNNPYTSRQSVQDGISVISLQSLDPGTGGMTTTYWNINSGGWYIAEADIVINSNLNFNEDRSDFNYNYPQKFFSTNYHSFLGLVTHELGHVHDIAHSSEASNESNPILKNATMYYIAKDGSNSTAFATLNEYDIKGIRAAYNGTPYSNWYWEPGCAAYYYAHGWTYSKQQATQYYPEGGFDQGTFIFVNPHAKGSSWDNVVVDNSALKYNMIDQQTIIEWNQFDVNLAVYVEVDVVDQNDNTDGLVYGLNAPDWWSQRGWVNMSSDASKAGYNKWVVIDRNLYSDYQSKYGTSKIPVWVARTRVGHMVYTGWDYTAWGGVMGIFYK